MFKILRSLGRRLFFVVPLGENGRYVVPHYDSDITHQIRESKDWWIEKCQEHDLEILSADYLVEGMKQNYIKWEKGNLFVCCRSLTL
jgi:hypothetical protein